MVLGGLSPQAGFRGGPVHEVTEMYWMLDLKADQHRASLDPEENWENLQYVYQSLASHPRPINNTKIYGADEGPEWAGSTLNAEQKFWRNIMGGSASSRVHRPTVGLGLSEPARIQIKSLRMLAGAMNIFSCSPRNALYFPDGGRVTLDLSAVDGTPQVRWLNIRENRWLEPVLMESGNNLDLNTPGDGPWAALVALTRPPDRG